ncbi:heavy metal translocating P-type ATPase [Dermatophilus congolensis]|uniref:heavy metal translocating P-type ATPase n=1 Tax=Dermatophilus congolensis TaxID=1863 RepID=UPI00312C932F
MSVETTPREAEFAIAGMTCASCSSRVERKLNKLDGVEASVNLATERAHVTFGEGVTVEELIEVVEKTGYSATLLSGDADGQVGDFSGVVQGAPVDVSAGMLIAPGGSVWKRLFVEPSMQTRAVVALVLAIPVVVIAMVPPVMAALGGVRPWVELLLTVPVYFWAAFPFHRSAVVNARHGGTTMDTLVSIGISAAFWWSFVATLSGGTQHMYFETAAVVTAFLLVGRSVEQKAKHRGQSALRSLLELGACEVSLLVPDGAGSYAERRAGVAELKPGMLFRVRPGEKVATDGVVVDGRSAVDASLVTGESMPVDVVGGDEVTGGTLNTSGTLVVRATRVGSETTLAAITRLVERAQTGKAPVQRLADRVSSVFVPAVLVIAVVTLLGWLGTGHLFTEALQAAVSVLVIACPCALGLATPTALLVGTGRGAEMGVLIKGPEILESTRAVDTVVLDKTGTVTSGSMHVTAVETAGKLTKTAALQAAASVEAGSEHPVAVAIVEAAKERGVSPVGACDFTALPGAGARAVIKGTEVLVGKPDLFDVVPDELADVGAGVAGTTVFVGWGGKARATVTVTDEMRVSTPAGVDRLHELGLETYLLTGDNEFTAKSVAAEAGIASSNVIAGVRPEQKHAVVQRLQRQGKVVAMVGDGVNDAAALAQADLGLAMGSGTDVARESADIVLMRTEVAAVADAIGLSRRTLMIIKQNLFWAFAYNVVGIPLAAFGELDPMFAGGAMAASSVIVVMNSLRLRAYAREREAVVA